MTRIHSFTQPGESKSQLRLFWQRSNISGVEYLCLWHMIDSYVVRYRHNEPGLCRWYRVATMSRLLKTIGFFCKRALQKRPIIFRETYVILSCLPIVATPYNLLQSLVDTASCNYSVTFSFSKLNLILGPVCHVPLKRDQQDWEWRLRLKDTPNATGWAFSSVMHYRHRHTIIRILYVPITVQPSTFETIMDMRTQHFTLSTQSFTFDALQHDHNHLFLVHYWHTNTIIHIINTYTQSFIFDTLQ